MSTGFNPQYTQYQNQTMQPAYYYPQQSAMAPANYPAQTYPAPTASGVNIQIINPTANAGPVTQYPAAQPAVPLYQNASLYGNQNPGITYPMNYNAPINQTNNYNQTPQTQETPKTEDKNKKTKEKVILTDEYIMSLENYLNNQDAKIRLTAAKELLDRFKEDKTRKADPALTALLNKVIQDPKASVRYIGLTILDTAYAQGNEETVNILKQLQNRPDLEFGEDSRLASQILLKMSGQKIEVPDDSPQTKDKNTEAEAA